MAKNIIFDSPSTLELEVPEGTVSGQPVVIGGIVGVAITSRGAINNQPTKATVAVRPAPVVEVDVAGALTEGQPVFVNGSGGLTATEGENTLFGHFVGGSKPTGTAPARVRLV